MRKPNTILIIALLMSNLAFTQSDENFKSNGKPSVKIFTNYHSIFSDGLSANEFAITRAFFGYGYNFNKHFSGKILLDVGNPGVGGLHMTAYLKNAMLTYKQNSWTINFGLIGLQQFKTQERAWGYRYIYKSFQDQHKFGFSADLGMNITYEFDEHFSIDFTVINGEGYKTLAVDSSLRVGLGITINPINEITIRTYYDFIKKNGINQQSIAFFAAYTVKNFSLGVEYNKQLNNTNVGGQNLAGISFYGTVSIDKKWKFFGRYDDLNSNEILGTDWNIGKDGSMIIAGFEFKPTKGVKIAPNYQGWNPKDTSKKYITGLFMNIELKIN